jgi:hypothetical protein
MSDSAGGLLHSADRVAGLHRGRPVGEGCVLVEVAGRDSVAAAMALARQGGLRRLLPSVVYTGTEFGEVEALLSNVERLRNMIEPLGVEVMEPVVLGSPLWWRATIGRVNALLSRRYGPWHVCVGCHMYLHAVRAPLAWEAGISRQVGGERLGHKGKVKINQTLPAVEAYRSVLADFGVELELPLLELDDEEAILSLAGDWGEGEDQPDCVLSGNYRDPDGGVAYDESALRSYLEEYLKPATSRIFRSLKAGGETDYEAVVMGVIGRLPGEGPS